MIKLHPYDLFSPSSIPVDGIGKIRKPTLGDIADIGYSEYQMYLSYFLMNPDRVYNQMFGEGAWDELSLQVQSELSMFDWLTEDSMRDDFTKAVTFFVEGGAVWSEAHGGFIVNGVNKGRELECDGLITKDNFETFADIVRQVCFVSTEEEEEKKVPKFANERAKQIWLAQQKARKAYENAHRAEAEMYWLSNIVVKLVYKFGVQDTYRFTVYQAYVEFAEMIGKKQDDLMSAIYSHIGGEYDPLGWLKPKTKKEK